MNTNTFTHDPLAADLISRILYKDGKPSKILLIVLAVILAIAGYAVWPHTSTVDITYNRITDASGETAEGSIHLYLKTTKDASYDIPVKKGYIRAGGEAAELFEEYQIAYMTDLPAYGVTEGYTDEDVCVFKAYSSYEKVEVLNETGSIVLTASRWPEK